MTNSNPVMMALAEARLRQLSTKDRAMEAVVTEIVGPRPKHDQPSSETFKRWCGWCAAKRVTSLPASTSSCALFLIENAGFGIETALEHVRNISASHRNHNLADPTTDWAVTTALNRIAKLDPPRSWNADGRALFLGLPYAVQRFILQRENERDAAFRRSQNQLAEERKLLNAEPPKETHESTIQQNAASASLA